MPYCRLCMVVILLSFATSAMADMAAGVVVGEGHRTSPTIFLGHDLGPMLISVGLAVSGYSQEDERDVPTYEQDSSGNRTFLGGLRRETAKSAVTTFTPSIGARVRLRQTEELTWFARIGAGIEITLSSTAAHDLLHDPNDDYRFSAGVGAEHRLGDRLGLSGEVGLFGFNRSYDTILNIVVDAASGETRPALWSLSETTTNTYAAITLTLYR